MVNATTGLPGALSSPMVDQKGYLTPIWWQFINNLWIRTGANSGTPTLILDTISSTVGAMLYRGASIWQGLTPGAKFKVLRMGAQFPEWDSLDGNSFGSQPQSSFFVSPSAGAGNASFRTLATADLSPIAGEFPGTATNDNAAAGNIGEYTSSQIASGAAVALVSGTPKDITSLALTAGDWDVWANVGSAPAGTTTTSIIRAWINTASATDPGAPNAGAYVLEQLAIAAGLSQLKPVGMIRVSVPAGGATVYLSTSMAFAVSTMGAFGFLGARRAR